MSFPLLVSLYFTPKYIRVYHDAQYLYINPNEPVRKKNKKILSLICLSVHVTIDSSGVLSGQTTVNVRKAPLDLSP